MIFHSFDGISRHVESWLTLTDCMYPQAYISMVGKSQIESLAQNPNFFYIKDLNLLSHISNQIPSCLAQFSTFLPPIKSNLKSQITKNHNVRYWKEKVIQLWLQTNKAIQRCPYNGLLTKSQIDTTWFQRAGITSWLTLSRRDVGLGLLIEKF